MKNKIKIIVVLLTLVFGVFSFLSSTLLLPRAGATYVEGEIVQDTIWTLVDSPFVISKNITVYPNATLTIEPGVKIGFGGNIPFVVQGRLIANGTIERNIKFTSNAHDPRVGDWGSISFYGMNTSVMTNCVIEYGTNGLHVENGNLLLTNATLSNCQGNGITVTNASVNIRNCNVSLCGYDGINATYSTLLIQESTLMQNSANGIAISGNNNATIQNNRIIANENGIALTGNITSGINITQNIISANAQSGILFDAASHSNVTITRNTISSNMKGVSILTPISTNFTENSVSYNYVVGIEYSQGNHTATHNDIYGNMKGMYVITTNTTINAEHNYWGDPTGPYHRLLNPDGRGNAVGGDDDTLDFINLDFIFFLTKPISHINIRPVASLITDKALVSPNQQVTFFGTNSTDEGHVDMYLFNFDDGKSSGWTTLSVFAYKYSLVGTFHANLTVMDDFGATSDNVSVIINVQNLTPLQASLDIGRSRVNEGEQISIVVHVTHGMTAAQDANVLLFSVKGGSFASLSGLTNATGYFTTTFTAPDVATVTNVRIVARASMSGYADGSDFAYLEVLPFLMVQLTPDSSIIKSEGSTPITVTVTSSGQPVANTYLTLTTNYGNLSSTTGITNQQGTFSLVLTAPLTTQNLSIIINAVARKDLHIDGAGQTTIAVEPKKLSVQLSASPDILISGSRANVTVNVAYESTLIEGANVIAQVTSGSTSQTLGMTDSSGNFAFIFTAPAVNENRTIIVTANASMAGYADGQNQLYLAVNPRTFSIKVLVSPNTIEAELDATVIVNVTCKEDGTVVAGALVTMSSTEGEFPVTNQTTDVNGQCAFVFRSPPTTIEVSVNVTAEATKEGFAVGRNQTSLTVVPKAVAEVAGGFPILLMLLILIPMVIVAIVVVLIKMKVVTFENREEA